MCYIYPTAVACCETAAAPEQWVRRRAGHLKQSLDINFKIPFTA